ncbi:peptidoglycan-binding domain-containing protein [Mycolicibacterium fortuitum]|uniref:peptidoglycan-binding domain-containing protein n=1 Tax=Mycolicibacterium fortuitum TaxID=1766 RepID=UPI0011314D87|nr:peptidoglycan-binding domain-containing protein [Mycolicibacterium fortuitum]TPW93644.1 peptidoglycan-binding protein [Mycolicibacterium fortuitum]
MTARLPLTIGSSDARGDDVTHWQRWAKQYAKAYADIMGAVDGYYGNSDAAFTREMQRRLGLPQTGEFDETTAARVGYAGTTAPARRPIWLYSAPGSGADWWLGPSFDVGQMVSGNGWNEPGRQSLRINHQPIGYAKGGYLGLMGGDPAFSYIDVIGFLRNELARLLRQNPDVQRAMTARRADPGAKVDVELWFSGYSQSADGMREAIRELFGDGGEFESIRDRINGLVLFGDPATPVTGIARKTFPAWLNSLVREVNATDDFYAVAKDKIRPLFYEWFIRAETELPFVVYTAQIIIPALLNLIAPFLGSLASPLAVPILAGATGVDGGLLGQVLGGVTGSRERPNPELVKLLSVQGVLTSLPDLIALVAALPGLQSHGAYHATMPPRPEFGNRTGTQYAYDIVASFRR